MSEGMVGIHTIYGADGEYDTPYMTRIWIGRLRLHVFHRGDTDPDCHDHPWDFWTFPLTSYVEEVVGGDGDSRFLFRQAVPAFRLHYRPAEHTHRVLGRSVRRSPSAPGDYRDVADGRIVTIVWQGRARRKWGFLRSRDGNWCWTPWRQYVFGGGKHAPCEPTKRARAT